MATAPNNPTRSKFREHPFRQAVLRGLGVISPPLFTILIFVWVINMTHQHVLEPVTGWVRAGLVWRLEETREDLRVLDSSRRIAVDEGQLRLLFSVGSPLPVDLDGRLILRDLRQEFNSHEIPLSPKASVSVEEKGAGWSITDRASVYKVRKEADALNVLEARKYYQLEEGTFVPLSIYQVAEKKLGKRASKLPAEEIYASYVDSTTLRPYYTVPFFVAVFVLLLYLLGKFMAAGIGRFFVRRIERGVHRLPLISNVYSAVKQVSDFLFSEPEIQYTRVVALEYPRKGIWTLAFVTGEGMLDICAVANEPVLTLFVSTSPMPLTGFAITARKSETIDLNITIDQAFQFIISCGVVVPQQQLQQMLSSPDALPAPVDAADLAEKEPQVADGG